MRVDSHEVGENGGPFKIVPLARLLIFGVQTRVTNTLSLCPISRNRLISISSRISLFFSAAGTLSFTYPLYAHTHDFIFVVPSLIVDLVPGYVMFPRLSHYVCDHPCSDVYYNWLR